MFFICDSMIKKANAKKKIVPSEAGKRSYFRCATQHLCSCRCRYLFCVECRFRGRAGGERWVGVEWLMSGWRRGALLQYSLDGERPVYTHTRTPTYTHLNLGACKHTSSRTHADAHYTQTVFEGRCNHGDTHLRAVVATWRWLRPCLDAQRDEQSQHWHTSRRHVNSNHQCLSVNT